MSDNNPLPQDLPYDAEADMWASWWLAVRAIGERVEDGEPLPDMFRPSQEAAECPSRTPAPGTKPGRETLL